MTRLVVENLSVEYRLPQEVIRAVNDVSLRVEAGEILGIVGESGSGKSTLVSAIMRLIRPPGRIVGGGILFEGVDLLSLDEEEMRKVRGSMISMVFQDPSTYLNPVYTVGFQVAEVFEAHGVGKFKKVVGEVIKLFRRVRLSDPEVRVGNYPHELSGGMKQRILISMALALKPKLIIADEPTSALDATIQAEILDLLKELVQENNISMIFITHDIGVVARIADRIAVMYAGRVVEEGRVGEVLSDPMHPYTKALVASVKMARKAKLYSIPGTPPNMLNPPPGCPFHPRCPIAVDRCRVWRFNTVVRGDRRVACLVYEDT